MFHPLKNQGTGIAPADIAVLQSIAQAMNCIIFIRGATSQLIDSEVVPKPLGIKSKTKKQGLLGGFVVAAFHLKDRDAVGPIEFKTENCQKIHLKFTAIELQQRITANLCRVQQKEDGLIITDSTLANIIIKAVPAKLCENWQSLWEQQSSDLHFNLFFCNGDARLHPIMIYCDEQGVPYVPDYDLVMMIPLTIYNHDAELLYTPYDTSTIANRNLLLNAVRIGLPCFPQQVRQILEKVVSELTVGKLRSQGVLTAFELIAMLMANQSLTKQLQHGPENRNPDPNAQLPDNATIFAVSADEVKRLQGKDAFYAKLVKIIRERDDLAGITVHPSWKQDCTELQRSPTSLLCSRDGGSASVPHLPTWPIHSAVKFEPRSARS